MKANKIIGVVCLLSAMLFCDFVFAGSSDDLGKTIVDGIFGQPKKTQNNQQQPQPQNSPSSATNKTPAKEITYSGYANTFMPVKKLESEGRINDAVLLNNKISSAADSDPLPNLEGGILALDAGQSDDAIKRLASAETIFAKNDSGSKVGGWLSGGGSFLAESVLGNEELGAYSGEGYEKVLMLNLKSIAYLLTGERKAYNVTRRAINWQDVERRRFEEDIQKAKEELKKEEKGQRDKGNDVMSFNLSSLVAKEYTPMEKKAASLPSAYVNPFAYYVAGMVQEFESFDDKSLRDNALISYKKALELNPVSRVLKEAVNDLQKKGPGGSRLVHVVAGDGFVPEKKLLTLGMNLKGTIVPVKLPIYMPVPSLVHHIEVSSGNGQKLATLSTVADIEAMCLRFQKDATPMRDFRVMLAVVRSYFEKQALKNTGDAGAIIGAVRDGMATPDMRSWMDLPATMQAARFYAPAGMDKIKLTTYDANGNILASTTISIDSTSHNFVYVRSIDRTLYAASNKKLWLAEK